MIRAADLIEQELDALIIAQWRREHLEELLVEFHGWVVL